MLWIWTCFSDSQNKYLGGGTLCEPLQVGLLREGRQNDVEKKRKRGKKEEKEKRKKKKKACKVPCPLFAQTPLNLIEDFRFGFGFQLCDPPPSLVTAVGSPELSLH